MESNNYFSLNRVYLLLIRQLNLNYKSWIIAISGISGLLLVVSLISTYRNGFYSPEPLTVLGTIVLFIGGYIFTSQVFNELNDRIRGLFYLSLPASGLEKLFVSWLISSFGFTAVILSMLFVVSLLASGISNWYVETKIQFINPFNLLKVSGIYIVTQSIFFLGAVYFKKFNFLKTLLALFVIFTFLSIWISLISYILFHDFNFELMMPVGENQINIKINLISKYLFWGFMAPYFLILAYLRLNEREV